jgi:hypothetical protein
MGDYSFPRLLLMVLAGNFLLSPLLTSILFLDVSFAQNGEPEENEESTSTIQASPTVTDSKISVQEIIDEFGPRKE